MRYVRRGKIIAWPFWGKVLSSITMAEDLPEHSRITEILDEIDLLGGTLRAAGRDAVREDLEYDLWEKGEGPGPRVLRSMPSIPADVLGKDFL
jgi:hypothetical protein